MKTSQDEARLQAGLKPSLFGLGGLRNRTRKILFDSSGKPKQLSKLTGASTSERKHVKASLEAGLKRARLNTVLKK